MNYFAAVFEEHFNKPLACIENIEPYHEFKTVFHLKLTLAQQYHCRSSIHNSDSQWLTHIRPSVSQRNITHERQHHKRYSINLYTSKYWKFSNISSKPTTNRAQYRQTAQKDYLQLLAVCLQSPADVYQVEPVVPAGNSKPTFEIRFGEMEAKSNFVGSRRTAKPPNRVVAYDRGARDWRSSTESHHRRIRSVNDRSVSRRDTFRNRQRERKNQERSCRAPEPPCGAAERRWRTPEPRAFGEGVAADCTPRLFIRETNV